MTVHYILVHSIISLDWTCFHSCDANFIGIIPIEIRKAVPVSQSSSNWNIVCLFKAKISQHICGLISGCGGSTWYSSVRVPYVVARISDCPWKSVLLHDCKIFSCVQCAKQELMKHYHAKPWARRSSYIVACWQVCNYNTNLGTTPS